MKYWFHNLSLRNYITNKKMTYVECIHPPNKKFIQIDKKKIEY